MPRVFLMIISLNLKLSNLRYVIPNLKNIWKNLLVVEELKAKSNSLTTIAECFVSSQDATIFHTLFTITLLTTLVKSEKCTTLTMAEITSLFFWKDKSFLKISQLINQATNTLVTTTGPVMNSNLVVALKLLAATSELWVSINSPLIFIRRNITRSSN